MNILFEIATFLACLLVVVPLVGVAIATVFNNLNDLGALLDAIHYPLSLAGVVVLGFFAYWFWDGFRVKYEFV